MLEELLGEVPVSVADPDSEAEEGTEAGAPEPNGPRPARGADSARLAEDQPDHDQPGSESEAAKHADGGSSQAAARPPAPAVGEADQALADSLRERLAAGRAWEQAAQGLLLCAGGARPPAAASAQEGGGSRPVPQLGSGQQALAPSLPTPTLQELEVGLT